MSKKQDRIAQSVQNNPALKFITQPELEQPEPQEEQPSRKPLTATEEAIIERYNAGMTVQKDIAAAINKDRGTVSKALKHIRNEYPERLHEPEPEPISTVGEVSTTEPEETKLTKPTAPQNKMVWKPEAETEGILAAARVEKSEPQKVNLTFAKNAPESPVMVQTDKSAPKEEKAENEPKGKPGKAKKGTFGFRATTDNIQCWKLYAQAKRTADMGEMFTAAIAEYISRNPLTDEEQERYDQLKSLL